MTAPAKRILQRYCLDPENAADYLLYITAYNQQDTAEQIGLNPKTINQTYKKAFRDMTLRERAVVYQYLLSQFHGRLTDI